jgi:hypothetical protein
LRGKALTNEEIAMAHHGGAGKNAVPSGNAKKGAARTAAGAASKMARGRTAKTTAPDRTAGPNAREGNVRQERLTEASRPIGPGGGKKRGDRQDTHPDPGRRNNERSGLRNDRNPSSTAGRRNNKRPNEGG